MKFIKKMKDGRRFLSLYEETILWVGLSMAAAVALFFSLNPAQEGLYDAYESGFVVSRTDAAVATVQNYITEHQLTSEEAEQLQPVLKKNDLSSFQIYMDGMMILNYTYGRNIDSVLYSEEDYADWETRYTIQFADGDATAYTDGVSVSQFMNTFLVIRILLCFLLFFILICVGARIVLRRIRRLHEDIHMLETGNLDYAIQVDGKDGLTELQKGLDQMRLSLKLQMDQEKYLLDSNRKLITEMSHDLRTPLTSILMYAEILKMHKYKNPQQADQYIGKVEQKAAQIKRMTDNMFEYALVGMDTEADLEEPGKLGEMFYDILSDFAGYMAERGFSVQNHLSWPDVQIRVNTNYLSRVMDNITSNIEKYADKSRPVDVEAVRTTVEGKNYAGITIENTILKNASHEESSGIGTRSMENMMHAMKGLLFIKTGEDNYRICILFPEVKEKE